MSSCRSTGRSTRCTTTTRTARCATHHNGNQPVYAPNSYGGPKADPQRYRDPSWFVEAAEIMRTAYEAHKDDNDFIQPGTLYRAGDDADRSGPSGRATSSGT